MLIFLFLQRNLFQGYSLILMMYPQLIAYPCYKEPSIALLMVDIMVIEIEALKIWFTCPIETISTIHIEYLVGLLLRYIFIIVQAY